MKVESYRESGRILVRPLNKKDLPLFKHCAGGSIAVTTQVFNSEVKPLLLMHGVAELKHYDKT